MDDTIDFCGERHHSKASLVRRTRAVRDQYEPGDRVKSEHEIFIMALLLKHPDYQEKISGREISHFEVRRYKYQTLAFFIVFADGSAADFSFMKSIKEIANGD